MRKAILTAAALTAVTITTPALAQVAADQGSTVAPATLDDDDDDDDFPWGLLGLIGLAGLLGRKRDDRVRTDTHRT